MPKHPRRNNQLPTTPTTTSTTSNISVNCVFFLNCSKHNSNSKPEPANTMPVICSSTQSTLFHYMYSVSKSESKSYHAHPSGYTTAQESGLCITMAEERDAALLYTDGRLHGSKIVWSVCKAG